MMTWVEKACYWDNVQDCACNMLGCLSPDYDFIKIFKVFGKVLCHFLGKYSEMRRQRELEEENE